ncbi:hypothetical protein LF41_2651 [Lysobacter dokdonensis DS-58]|uniref:Lipoprotein n=1 Tax=Lysobacter dokdonensis DS-58 TaxID=1300345 RepID=A0A0A2WIV1_9GAMM|nr:hypothetical protein [Lysobacter dokdonensis]KGQ19713.1 hypothetical protein LF41_2651 [Lysobacter dokdonensis DS-58]
MIRTTLAALVAACAFTACASNTNAGGGTTTSQESTMRSITAGSSETLSPKETVKLPDGATLQYVAVTQDSRCPPNARCIRAGDADIEFVFATGGGPQATVKANLPEAPSKNMGAWRLTVEALEFNENPVVTVRVDKAQ